MTLWPEHARQLQNREFLPSSLDYECEEQPGKKKQTMNKDHFTILANFPAQVAKKQRPVYHFGNTLFSLHRWLKTNITSCHLLSNHSAVKQQQNNFELI